MNEIGHNIEFSVVLSHSVNKSSAINWDFNLNILLWTVSGPYLHTLVLNFFSARSLLESKIFNWDVGLYYL